MSVNIDRIIDLVFQAARRQPTAHKDTDIYRLCLEYVEERIEMQKAELREKYADSILTACRRIDMSLGPDWIYNRITRVLSWGKHPDDHKALAAITLLMILYRMRVSYRTGIVRQITYTDSAVLAEQHTTAPAT